MQQPEAVERAAQLGVGEQPAKVALLERRAERVALREVGRDDPVAVNRTVGPEVLQISLGEAESGELSVKEDRRLVAGHRQRDIAPVEVVEDEDARLRAP